mmetsp:Transcript_13804/g.40513  ORF Transcript_13804/g.40513 Transcript_13804/m.40513 type:complete len:209 (+) Transcript_13804:341-967(+)
MEPESPRESGDRAADARAPRRGARPASALGAARVVIAHITRWQPAEGAMSRGGDSAGPTPGREKRGANTRRAGGRPAAGRARGSQPQAEAGRYGSPTTCKVESPTAAPFMVFAAWSAERGESKPMRPEDEPISSSQKVMVPKREKAVCRSEGEKCGGRSETSTAEPCFTTPLWPFGAPLLLLAKAPRPGRVAAVSGPALPLPVKEPLE